MNTSNRIAVVGSHAPGIFFRVKRIPVAGETVIGWGYQEPKDGGKGSNQAIAAAMLGGNVSFIGCVGNDRIGLEGKKWMNEAGVDTTWLLQHPSASSGVGVILLDEHGVPAMVTSMGANEKLTKRHIKNALSTLKDAKVMMTQFEIPTELALYAAAVAKELGMITIVNPAPAPEKSITKFDMVSVLLPNESEAQGLLGLQLGKTYDAAQMAEELFEKTNSENVIITLGEKGAVGCDSDGCWKIESPKVQVVDTSGAGDVFCAAFAVSLSNGSTVRSASEWACQVASMSVTRSGTIPSFPTDEELRFQFG